MAVSMEGSGQRDYVVVVTILYGSVTHKFVELEVRHVGSDGAVITEDGHLVFGDVNPATGLSVSAPTAIRAVFERGGVGGFSLITLINDIPPVANTTHEIADVDQVEVILAERPILLHIVNLEAYIGRDPGRLDRAEIGTDDLGGGVLSVLH